MNAKRVTKRVVAVVLTMMLALSCFVLPSVLNASAAAETKVNIHYLREDGNYGDWDVWAWADGLDGAGYAFTDSGDAHGAVATVTITESTPKLGFIIRKPDWSAKDPEPDRFIDLSSVVSGTVEVYSISGQEDFETDYSGAVLGLKIKTANAASKTSVEFTLTKTPDDGDVITADDFTIVSAGGQNVSIESVEMTAGTVGILTLGEEIDYSKEYNISFRDSSMKLTLPDYFSSAEFEEAYTYTGDDLGVTFADSKTNFRVWAPTAQKLEINIYAEGNGGSAEQVVEMTASEKGTWTASFDGNLSGKYYTYTAYFDGKTNKDIVDPYAKSVGVNGKRGMILDMSTTDPDGWNSDSRHTYENVTDLQIYEVHVRDFSISETNGIENKGKYLAFTERGTKDESGVATGVDHLVDLGVTSVHILPTYDYGSVDETKLDKAQYNWGYDPVNYNAPEGSYSTDPYHGEVRVNEYKQMVQGLHNAGLGVIMDVVYNHTYNTQYCFNQLVPGYFYRPGQNTSGCGNDVASERSMVSKFIVDSVKYWASEYHLDGFRFDLMGIIDVDTMNAVRAAVDEIDPSIVIYGEGWNMGSVPTKQVDMANYLNADKTPRIAYFSDTIRDTVKGSVFDAEEKGYVNGESKHYKALINSIVPYTKKWSPSPVQTINYADCHDNLTLWDKIRSSNSDDSEEDQIRQNNLAAVIIQTSQGIPFMMSGEEFLRTKTKEDGSFDHNSYASSDEVNALDYSRIAQYSDVYEYYKGLIAFRKAHPALRMTTVEDVDANYSSALDKTEEGVAAFTLKGGVNSEQAEEIMVVYNPLSEDTKVTLPEGDWDVYVNDVAAGNKVLATVSGEVSVPRISAMVLVKGYEALAEASAYSIIGSMTDWSEDIAMYEVEPGIFEGTFEVGPGTHQFKVRKDASWDLSWGAYEADYDRTQNSQTNIEFTTTDETTTVVVRFDTTGDDLELWPVSYSLNNGEFIYTGKISEDEPSKDESSKDESSKEDVSKDDSSVDESSNNQTSDTDSKADDNSQNNVSQDSKDTDVYSYTDGNVTNTGDAANNILYMFIMIVAVAGVSVALVSRKSRISK